MDIYEELSRYTPRYVEAYLENATPGQTIEEWTDAEGSLHFTDAEIYAPMEVPVAIAGNALNAFMVDLCYSDWYDRLEQAVKQSLIEAKLAQPDSSVSLRDVCGQAIAHDHPADLAETGVLYATVDKKRSVDLVKTPALGCMAATPASHCINKHARLMDFVGDLLEEAEDTLVKRLASVDSIVDVEALLADEADKRHLKPVLEDLVAARAPFKSVESMVEAFSSATVSQSLANGALVASDFCSDVANHMLDAVADGIRSKRADVEDMYRSRQLQQRTQKAAKNAKRRLFGSKTTEQVHSPAALYRSIVRESLSAPEVGSRVMLSFTDGPSKWKARSQRKRLPKRAPSSQASVQAAVKPYPIHEHASLLEDEPARQLESLRVSHALSRIACHPGTRAVRCPNRMPAQEKDEKKKKKKQGDDKAAKPASMASEMPPLEDLEQSAEWKMEEVTDEIASAIRKGMPPLEDIAGHALQDMTDSQFEDYMDGIAAKHADKDKEEEEREDRRMEMPVDSEMPALHPIASDMPSLEPVLNDMPPLEPMASDMPPLEPMASDMPAPKKEGISPATMSKVREMAGKKLASPTRTMPSLVRKDTQKDKKKEKQKKGALPALDGINKLLAAAH